MAELSGVLSSKRSIMADCIGLIKPKRILGPGMTSYAYKNVFLELDSNQKRGVTLQNNPGRMKRDQEVKQQRQEQEAQKDNSELAVVLQKRQQKMEQPEPEQQKCKNELETTPEFFIKKKNLWKTKQEAEPQERSC